MNCSFEAFGDTFEATEFSRLLFFQIWEGVEVKIKIPYFFPSLCPQFDHSSLLKLREDSRAFQTITSCQLSFVCQVATKLKEKLIISNHNIIDFKPCFPDPTSPKKTAPYKTDLRFIDRSSLTNHSTII